VAVVTASRAVVAGAPAPADEAAALIRAHGWEATSFQLLGPSFRHWLGDGGDGHDGAVVGYAATRGAWVAGGSPVAPPGQLARSAEAFVAAARAAGRRACFFAADERLAAATGWRAVRLGLEPSWDPTRWDGVLAGHASLRYQVRRARHKGVEVRALGVAELAPGAPARAAADRVIDRWLAGRRMPPMHFLVDLAPFSRPAERRYWLAERDGQAVGFAIASPVYARGGWFVEHLLRDGAAPNGTVELLVDAILRDAAWADIGRVTLGLAPLAGPLGPALRAARWLGTPLYDFHGLHAFKAKLGPDRWDAIDLVVPPGVPRWLAVRDSLVAFAGGSMVVFGARSAVRLARRSAERAARWYRRAAAPR
jgi:phosphatidylglycerol lysyltransferase